MSCVQNDRAVIKEAFGNTARASRLFLWWVHLVALERKWFVYDGWMGKVVWYRGLPYMFETTGQWRDGS